MKKKEMLCRERLETGGFGILLVMYKGLDSWQSGKEITKLQRTCMKGTSSASFGLTVPRNFCTELCS